MTEFNVSRERFFWCAPQAITWEANQNKKNADSAYSSQIVR